MKTRFYICSSEGCHQSFRDEKSLEKHALEHNDPSQENAKNFFCSSCHRSLATKQSFKEHLFIHLKKKIFRCSEIGCGKLFRQNSQLCNHRKVHKEAKKILGQKKLNYTKIAFDEAQAKPMDDEKIPDCFFDEAKHLILPPIRKSQETVVLPNMPSFNSYITN